jgi:hypothetical protein
MAENVMDHTALTLEPTAASEHGEAPRRYDRPPQAWEVLFLVALVASILLAAVWQSNKAFFNNDELCTAVLVSNPSFSQMWNTIRHGGELNPPLFFALEWVVARLCGPTELMLRAISMVSVALAGGLLFLTIRPLTGPRLAAVAISLVFGLSRDVFYFSTQARYYALLFLLVSLGVFLALRLQSAGQPSRRRDYLLVFLTHCAMVYLHLYGLLFSGTLLLAMVAADAVRGQFRWRLYAAVLTAWAAFGLWIPTMLRQLKIVSGGVFVPPGYNTFGVFFEELALQIPLATVFLLILLLGGLALSSASPCRATEEAGACADQAGWAGMALVALALMAVPAGAWALSLIKPGFFMRRYVFASTAAWLLIVALVLLAVHRLPRPRPGSRLAFSPRLWTVASFFVLAFCLLFQPVRARKNPPRPVAPFEDAALGAAYDRLPLVFENSWYFLPRVFYGQGREYLLLIDHEAAQADPGWYTRCNERFYQAWYPRYHNAHIAFSKDLPDSFLAVDDDYTRTFEWIFAHHPEFKPRLLATVKADVPLFGEQRIYLVEKR